MLGKFRETAITWDKANRKIYESLRASAGDNKGRKLSVQLVNDGVVEDLTGASLSLFWETRDKTNKGLDAFTAVDATKGEFEIYYTTGMLSNEGTLNANLVLVDTSGRVVSEPFTITVFKGVDDEAVQSSDSFTALAEALITVNQYNSRITNVESTKVDKSTFEQNKLSVDQQLQQNTEEQRKFKESKSTEKKLYVTLHDDDGKTEFITKLKPILDEYGIKMSLAINPGLVGQSGFMTWTQIKQLHAEGHEILNHTMGTGGTQIRDKSWSQMEADYEAEKAAFIENGFDTYDYLVYSGVMPWQDTVTRNKITQFYKCCFANTDAPKNGIPFDNYAIHRASLTYNWQQTIDEYIEMGAGYLILFQHAWMYTEADLQTLRSVLDYLLSKNVEFVTSKKMVDDFSNVINLGNAGQDKFLLDKNGNVNFSVNGLNVNEMSNVFVSKVGFTGQPITDYKQNTVTFEKIGGTFASFWLPQSGVIRTVRMDDDRFSYQEFNILNGIEIWSRNWNVITNDWDYFSPVSGISVSTANRPKFIKRGVVIHDYTINKIIYPQADGFGVPYVQVARSTPYAKGVYVNASTDSNATNNRLYECIVAGTTSDIRPTYTTVKNEVTTDGTAQFKYIGDRAVYRDAMGTVI